MRLSNGLYTSALAISGSSVFSVAAGLVSAGGAGGNGGVSSYAESGITQSDSGSGSVQYVYGAEIAQTKWVRSAQVSKLKLQRPQRTLGLDVASFQRSGPVPPHSLGECAVSWQYPAAVAPAQTSCEKPEHARCPSLQ